MNIRDRISQFTNILVTSLRLLDGPRLVGRSGTGAGPAEEIAIGDGLTLEGGILRADAIEETTESILEKLQGDEADPTRIGAEYFPLVQNVDALILADTAGLILESNALARNGDTLVLHDAAIPGGTPIEGWILRGGATHHAQNSPGANQLATQKVLTIADISFSASSFTPGETVELYFCGKIAIHSALGNYTPATNPRIVFYFLTAGATELTNPKGVGVELATAAAPEPYTMIDLNELVALDYTDGYLTITGQTANLHSRMRKVNSSSVITDSNISIKSLQAFPANRKAPLSPYVTLRLALVLPADTATADVTGHIMVSSDIRLQRTAPWT